MLAYITRRLFQALGVGLGVVILIFIISHLLPANPAKMWAGRKSTSEQVEAVRKEHHLDEPVVIQLGYYLRQLLSGDLGTSPLTHHPVSKDLARYTPATVELLFFSFLMALLLGTPLGVMASVNRGGIVDNLSRLIALGGVAVPRFWSGLLFQLVFFFYLGWLPTGGRISESISFQPTLTRFYTIDSLLSGKIMVFFDSLQHIFLPALCLSLYSIATLTRVIRASMIETLSKEYIKTAKSKGLPERLVIYKHALRNSFSASLTIVGMSAVYLLGGSVVVETVFSWPGIGRYAASALTALDFPALMGFSLVVGFGAAFIDLTVDLLYAVLDPRVRLE